MKKTLLGISVLLAIAGCSDRTPQAVAPTPIAAAPAAAGAAAAPVIVNQPAANSGVGDMLMGGALGYMLGRNSGSSNNGGDNHTTVNKTVVHKTVVVQQAPAKPAPAPVATPAPKQSFGGSYGSTYATKPSTPAPKQSFGSSYSSSRSTSFSSPSRSSFGGRR